MLTEQGLGAILQVVLTLLVSKVACHECSTVSLSNSTGWITSPDYDRDGLYENDLLCLWVIFADDNEIIGLEFLEMDIEFDQKCRYDYLDVIDGVFLTGTFCGTEVPEPIISEAREVLLIFYTDRSAQGKGFKAIYRHQEDARCGYRVSQIPGSFGSMDDDSDGHYDSNSSCLWTVNQVYYSHFNAPLLQLYLTDLDIQPGENCQFDYIEVFDNLTSFGRYCGSSQPPVITSSSDFLEIHFESDGSINGRGFTAYYADTDPTGECGGILTETTGEIHSIDQDGDGFYDSGTYCRWLIVGERGVVIKLTFFSFDLQWDGFCSTDRVLVFDGFYSRRKDNLIGRYCGGVIPKTLRSTTHVLSVQFETNDLYEFHTGFTAKYTQISNSSCTYLIVDFPGRFGPNDNNFDGLYDYNLSCTWSLYLPPNNNGLVQVYLTELDIQEDSDCQFDYVEVFDNGTSVGRYCGSSKPPVITSRSDTLEIRFVSDGNINGRGFIAYYTFIDVYRECGGILTERTGVITAVEGDSDYFPSDNSGCGWLIIADKGNLIELKFTRFDLLPNEVCFYEYVMVYDGDFSGENELIGKFCGTITPYPIRSKTNVIHIHFKTDEFHIYSISRFTATYATVNVVSCNRNITGPGHSGRFGPTVNNFDGLYEFNLSCTWALNVPSDDGLVQVYITDLSIQHGNHCQFDYVEVLDKGESLGRYCGSIQPPVITSSSNTLDIHFVSDGNISDRGFIAYYTFTDLSGECGGILTEPTGEINSVDRDGDHMYDNDLDCLWLIIAEKGDVIELKFRHFDLEYDADCRFDFILLYDGDFSEENELIGEYCGTSIPYLTRSRTNVIRLHFKTDPYDAVSGFLVTYMIVNGSACYNQYSDRIGSFGPTKSDGFHESGFSCRWVLVGSDGKLVQVYLTELDVEESDGCHRDYVEVIDDGTSVGRYCGTSQPPVITSSSKTLEIRFESNGRLHGKGCIAYYANTDSTGICGGILTEPTGDITSLNRGDGTVYQHDLDCRWLIVAVKGSVVQLEFHSFDIEEHHLCRYDYVLIYDGVSSDENDLLGRFCGQEIPLPVNSSGNVLHVQFKTDKLFALTGFTASYKHFRVATTTTQSIKDITSTVSTESTMFVTSSSYTAKITEDLVETTSASTASTFTTDKSINQTSNVTGSTINSSTSTVSTTLILVSKPLAEETSASDTPASTVSESVSTTSTVSESTGTYRNNTQPGTKEITNTATEDAAEDTTGISPTLLTSSQSAGASEKNVVTYVALFASLLELADF